MDGEIGDAAVIEILKKMLEKYPLDEREKAAVREAIGILGWSKLREGYMEGKKRARDKRLQKD